MTPSRRHSWSTAVPLLVAASVGHVLYPALLELAGAWRAAIPGSRRPSPGDGAAWPPGSWPAVTVVVPAYLEAAVIAGKVADLQANGYPGPLEVVVVADGDPDTAAAARRTGVTVIAPASRLGKAQALNAGVAAARTPVVVLTDANNRLRPGSIAALVRHLDDPELGAVAGDKVEQDSGGEELYWRFESRLKRSEWRLGTTIGLVGELAAVRTDAWRPIPEDIATDDLWTALDLSERGYRIAYEPSAVAVDPPVRSLADQWERRTRSVAGAMHVFNRKRHLLGPGGGLVALEIWGHRLARYTVVPLSHVGLLALALRRARSSWPARGFLLLHAPAVAAIWRWAKDPDRPPRGAVTAALASSVFLNAVALGGLWRYARGYRSTKWPRIDRGAEGGDRCGP